MAATDLKPSRLVQARFKVADLLARSREGQTGLVVFAGDAFVVSPLTQDANTIAALLPVLEPSLMPVQGSRVDLGLRRAAQLLEQAGLKSGEVLLVSDGSNGQPALTAAQDLRAAGFTISVLAVGTPEGAPIPVAEGGFMKDHTGNVLMTPLDSHTMEEIAAAGGGRYALISADAADVDKLLDDTALQQPEVQQTDRQIRLWREEGPWLVLLLVPLAALAFRRGWLLVLVVCLSAAPQSSMALGWAELWSRRDQQAAQALEQGDPARAAELAVDPMLRGSAQYRSGHYQQAAESFAQAAGKDAHYNRGNALAKLGRFEEALAAYDAALAINPAMEDAQFNRQQIEELLRWQPPQASAPDQQNSPPSQGQPPQAKADNQRDDQPGRSAGGADQQPATGGQQKEPSQADDRQADERVADQTKDSSAGQDKQANQQERTANQAPAVNAPERAPSSLSQKEDNAADEQQQIIEQWLRRIPDDPGGLLRRKFQHQYQRRAVRPDLTPHQEAW